MKYLLSLILLPATALAHEGHSTGVTHFAEHLIIAALIGGVAYAAYRLLSQANQKRQQQRVRRDRDA